MYIRLTELAVLPKPPASLPAMLSNQRVVEGTAQQRMIMHGRYPINSNKARCVVPVKFRWYKSSVQPRCLYFTQFFALLKRFHGRAALCQVREVQDCPQTRALIQPASLRYDCVSALLLTERTY